MSVPSSPAHEKKNVSLSTAYALWLFGGVWGLHHAYIGRSHQALLWFGSFGFFGVGWIRDGLKLPYYVALAQSDPHDTVVKIRNVTMEARKEVPPLSLLRIVMMMMFGKYFGMIMSCSIVLPKGWDEGMHVVESLLYAVGAVIGVLCVGNTGEETVDFKKPYLFLNALAGSIWDYPVLSVVLYATWSRKYRSSMVPQGTRSRRFSKHILACGALVAMITLAIYNHGSVNVNGRKVYASEAFHNARKSQFFKEFRYEDFLKDFNFQDFHSKNQNGGSNYLKQTLDLEGERAACRTLGVPVGADFTEIKTSYKSLALQYHPDKIGVDATEKEQKYANEQFLKIQNAYEVLTRIEQRKKAPKEDQKKRKVRNSRQRSDEF